MAIHPDHSKLKKIIDRASKKGSIPTAKKAAEIKKPAPAKEEKIIPEVEEIEITTTSEDNSSSEETPAIEKPETEIKEETIVEEIPVTEAKKEDIITEVNTAKKRISLFSDMKKKTEGDEKQKDKTEEVLEDLSGKNDDKIKGEEEEDEAYIKTMAKVTAGIYVELIDVVAMLLCIWIADEWNDEGQRRFTLVGERKNAMKTSIYQLLVARKKKPKPGVALFGLIAGSYTPLLITAIFAMIKRKKAAKEAKRLKEEAEAEKIKNPSGMTDEQKAFVKANPHLFGFPVIQAKKEDHVITVVREPVVVEEKIEEPIIKDKKDFSGYIAPPASDLTYKEESELEPPKVVLKRLDGTSKKDGRGRRPLNHKSGCGIFRRKKCNCGASKNSKKK